MDKQTINAVRSRARVAIHTTGGRVTGQHHRLPVVYACRPWWSCMAGNGNRPDIQRPAPCGENVLYRRLHRRMAMRGNQNGG